MKKITLTADSNTTLAGVIVSHGKLRKLVLAVLLLVFAFGGENMFAQLTPAHIAHGDVADESEFAKDGLTPFAKGKNKNRVQYLYEKLEIPASMSNKTITHIGFYVTDLNLGATGLVPVRNMTVKVTLCNAGAASNFKANNSNMHQTGGFTDMLTVSVSEFTISSTGWADIDLGEGFYYNRDDSTKNNIIIEICSDNTGDVALENFAVKMRYVDGRKTRGRFNWDNDVTALPVQDACSLPSAVAGSLKTTANYYGLVSSERYTRPEIRFTYGCSTQGVTGSAAVEDEGTGCLGSDVKLHVTGADKVSGLEYRWEVSETGNMPWTAIPDSHTEKLTVKREMTERYYRRVQSCANDVQNTEGFSAKIKVDGATWNKYENGVWSDGEPTAFSDTSIIIENGTYTVDENISACSCMVKPGATLIVQTGNDLTLTGPIVDGGGVIKFQDGSNLIQLGYEGENTGTIEYHRNSQPMVQYDYTYWSSPVSGATFADFAIGTEGTHFYSFNPAIQNWVAHQPTDEMVPGVGYIIRAPEPATPAEANVPTVFNGQFDGIPNNGTVKVPVLQTPKYALVGNPYPSAIDAEEFINDQLNTPFFAGTLYYWTHTSAVSTTYSGGNGEYSAYNADDYASFNAFGGTVPPSNPSATAPGQYIGAGQSFMIEGGDVPGYVTFTNDMRIGGTNNSQFFRPGTDGRAAEGTATSQSVEKHRIWLQIANNTHFKQILVGYSNVATEGVDRGYDGKAMAGTSLGFYSLIGGEAFGIQARSLPFNVSDIIPLGFNTAVAGTYRVSMPMFDGMFSEYDVYLEDLVTGTLHNLKDGEYTFTTAAGTFNSRFQLKYSGSALGTDTVLSGNELLVYKKAAGLHINSQNANLKDVKVYDLSGRLLTSKSDIASRDLVLDNVNWSTQVLVVQTTLEGDVLITKKVVY